MSVFEEYLYYTDWELKSVMRTHKYTGKDTKKIYTAVHRPMDIHVYHPFRQPPFEKPNPCEDGGGCETMCLLSPGGNKSCVCPENFVLAANGTACEPACPTNPM